MGLRYVFFQRALSYAMDNSPSNCRREWYSMVMLIIGYDLGGFEMSVLAIQRIEMGISKVILLLLLSNYNKGGCFWVDSLL